MMLYVNDQILMVNLYIKQYYGLNLVGIVLVFLYGECALT